ncbi:homologous-pairing protein 2 homolog isoform X1 [Pollicipes pollicipes]|uniref:homologous-pairing protein 2 homolog isoform X1 n=2 Tax=Pollicipes pollicipes TaxID=41117 RepID=UPI001884E574|nr:homologous-pairing protein 2 homolog isoform X1 [Pollicipes pollicipes]XP_037093161.1 homologous-pairing protein 2 homolog isoform X1 [Pollicipes pollicipes]XP_037093162.1 homologous-pairing protein 2 homolog isoform X1 [Pollicipes pollicipes]
MSDKTTSGIFKYLFDQNRPYSVTDIHMNLHKEYGKTAIQKSLDTLVEERKVLEKVYGKQKVYVVNQELHPKVEESELRSMDARIAQLTSELTGEGLALREAEGKLKALASSLTSAQAKQALVECEDDIREKTEKLSQLKKSSGNVTADDRRRVQDQHRKSLGEWRKRKRITNDIVDAIMEGYPKKKKDLYEEVGLETDQDVGVTLPS